MREQSHPKAGYTFPRASRLLKHASFEQVYKGGRRHFSTHFTAFYLLTPDRTRSGAQVGLTVGRARGGAVDRNRIKRRMRNLVRVHLPTLDSALRGRELTAEVVINPKKISLTAEFAKLDAEMARAFAVIAAAPLELKA